MQGDRDLISSDNTYIRRAVFCGITFLCIIMGALIIHRILISKHYRFKLDAFASEDMSVYENSVIITGETASTKFNLRNGNYNISISYQTNSDYRMEVRLDNDIFFYILLPHDQKYVEQNFTLEWPTDRAFFEFEDPDSAVQIDSIDIYSDSYIYTDGIWQLFILILLYLFFCLFFRRFDEYDPDKKIAIITLTIMIIALNLPLYSDVGIADGWGGIFKPLNAMTRFGIDTRAHLMRIEGVMYGLLDGQFPVIISPNMLNENGELSFLYPDVFIYPFAVLRILGASLQQVYRLITVAVNAATVLSMYCACGTISKDGKLNLFITAMYSFEPHRLYVVLGKGAAVGMGVPYIFIPWAIVGLWMIINKEKAGVISLAVGVTGTLQSHITSFVLVIMMLFVVFVFFVGVFLGDMRTRTKYLILSVCLAVVSNLGFLVVFFHYYQETNTSALRWTSLEENILSPLKLITNEESLFYVLVLAGVFFLLVSNNRNALAKMEIRFTNALVFCSVLFFLMTSTFFPWELLMRRNALFEAFAYYMQKPHRFYTVMASSVLIAILFLIKDEEERRKKTFAIIITVMGMSLSVIKVISYFNTEPILYDEVTGDITTKEIYDYLPVGVDAESRFSGNAELSDWDNVESVSYHKRGTHIDYEYSAYIDGIYADFPLLFYDGYEAEDETGHAIKINKGREGNVRVFLNGDRNKHMLHVKFAVKTLFKALYIMSWISFFVTITHSLIYYLVKRDKSGKGQ